MTTSKTTVPVARVDTSVAIGPTTIAGWGATVIGALTTILVATLDTNPQVATTLATAAFTIVAFAITQIGRYRQAQAKAERAMLVVPPSVE